MKSFVAIASRINCFFRNDSLYFINVEIDYIVLDFHEIEFFDFFLIWIFFFQCWFQLNYEYHKMNLSVFKKSQLIDQLFDFFNYLDRSHALFMKFLIFDVDLICQDRSSMKRYLSKNNIKDSMMNVNNHEDKSQVSIHAKNHLN